MRATATLLTISIVFSCLLISAQCYSTTYYVNGATGDDSYDGLASAWDGTHGPKKTIQAGIDASSDTDAVIVADGTYTGAGNKNLDFAGRAITLTSENGPDSCIIDCEGTDAAPHRGFSFDSGETPDSVLDGFTITGGLMPPYGGTGGGIAILNSSPTISDCRITGNEAYDHGGGIYINGGSPTITGCRIDWNVCSGGEGGGVASVLGSPQLISCVVMCNASQSGANGIYINDGDPALIRTCLITQNADQQNGTSASTWGGIFCSGNNAIIEDCDISWNKSSGACFESCDVTIAGCRITNNIGGEGAGLHFHSASGSISDCEVVGNWGVRGGGVYLERDSLVTFSRCTISGNNAELGGGIYQDHSCSTAGTNPELSNCIIAGNSATDSGGGIYCIEECEPVFVHCTIAENSAPVGSGVACYDESSPSFKNCILWDEETNEIFIESGTPVLDYCDVRGGHPGSGNFSADPVFLNPPGFDYRLTLTSPCIDAGTASSALPTDIHGESRWDCPSTPNTGDAGVSYYDVGADEYVDADLDTLPDYWEIENGLDPNDDGSTDIRNGPTGDPDSDSLPNIDECLRGTNPEDDDSDDDSYLDGDEIAAGTNPLHLDNPEKTYYVDGTAGDDSYDGRASTWNGTSGPKNTIQAGIDATIDGWDYTVEVADGTYTGPGNRDVIFLGKGVTLKSQHGPSSTTIDCENAGRAFNLGYHETTECVIDGFGITRGWISLGGYGSAIRCSYSGPKILNCVITNCTGYRGTVSSVIGDVTLESCTISGCTCESGGAVYCTNSSSYLTIINCVFSDNVATYQGGAICKRYSGMTISGTLIENNQAQNGGGMYTSSVNLVMDDCDIRGNHSTGVGGGLALGGGASSLVSDTRIAENTSGENGGGVSLASCGCTFERCVISGNTTEGDGAAIHSTDDRLRAFRGCLIINNSSGNRGGAAYLDDGDSTSLYGCTITANSAFSGEGGGILVAGDSALAIENSILWNNRDGEIYIDAGTASVAYSAVQGGWTGTGNIDADPMLTPDGHLMTGSPCIDACPTIVSDDLDGETRPFDMPGVGFDSPDTRLSDIGADEFVDSNANGLQDWWDSLYGSDPNSDNDLDGLLNGEEYERSTNPQDSDSDDDGLNDGDEVHTYGTDPLDPDSDDDGMPDGWEALNGTDPTQDDSSEDDDGDLLTNGEEYAFGTLANNSDTDDDGMPDGWEVMHVLDPLLDDADLDADGDGKTNIEELESGTDPQDKLSLFQVMQMTRPGSPDEVELAWSSAPGRWYFVCYCDGEMDEDMTWVIAAVIPASGTGINSWIDDGTMTVLPPSAVPHRQYIVMCYLPPI